MEIGMICNVLPFFSRTEAILRISNPDKESYSFIICRLRKKLCKRNILVE